MQKLYELKTINKSFVLDLGDFSEGSGFYELSGGGIEKSLLKRVCSGIIPGNHGFSEVLALSRQQSAPPIINCNIFQGHKPVFLPLLLLRVCRIKIGVIGVMSPEAFLSIPRKIRTGLTIKDPVKLVANLAQKFRRRCDFLILASHSGVEYDRNNFSSLADIDLILSSHCHTPGNFFNFRDKTIIKADEYGGSYGVVGFAAGKPEISFYKSQYRKIFSSPGLKPLNRKILNILNSMHFQVGFLSPNLKKQIQKPRQLLSRLLPLVQSKVGSFDACVVNDTFIRSFPLPPKILRKHVLDLFPFATRFVLVKSHKKKISRFFDSIPEEIKSASLLRYPNSNDRSYVSLLTTDYLLDNFFPNPKPKSEIQYSCREAFLNLLNENL